jgi:hypothetical protein
MTPPDLQVLTKFSRPSASIPTAHPFLDWAAVPWGSFLNQCGIFELSKKLFQEDDCLSLPNIDLRSFKFVFDTIPASQARIAEVSSRIRDSGGHC